MIPLQLNGVISHIRTRKPTAAEIDLYQGGVFQFAELTAQTPWEPYSTVFAETEDAARSVRVRSAVTVTRCCDTCVTSSAPEAEYIWRASPSLTQRCVAVASRLALQQPAELRDEDELATRLVAAVNIESFAVNGDGLDVRPEDSICDASEEE